MGRWLRVLLKAVVILLGLGIVALGSLWWISKPTLPDAFYTPTEALPPNPGALIRVEPFTRMVPSNAQAWRILARPCRRR